MLIIIMIYNYRSYKLTLATRPSIDRRLLRGTEPSSCSGVLLGEMLTIFATEATISSGAFLTARGLSQPFGNPVIMVTAVLALEV